MARDIRSLISDLAGAGATIFLTTHYMEEADRLSNQVAILDRGRIVALDSPARLKRDLGDKASLEDVFLHLTGRPFAETG